MLTWLHDDSSFTPAGFLCHLPQWVTFACAWSQGSVWQLPKCYALACLLLCKFTEPWNVGAGMLAGTLLDCVDVGLAGK